MAVVVCYWSLRRLLFTRLLAKGESMLESMGGLGGGGLTSKSSADGDNMFGDNSFDYRNASTDNKVTFVAIAFVSFVTGLIVAKAVK